MVPTEPQVYIVWYNSCIYESAPATISIHLTKAGAWKAMRKMIWDKAVEHREQGLCWAGRDWNRNLDPFSNAAYGIKAMLLNP